MHDELVVEATAADALAAAQRSPYRQVMAAGIPRRPRYVCIRAGFVAGPARR